MFKKPSLLNNLWPPNITLFKLNSDLSISLDILPQVDFTEGATADLLPHLELVVDPDLVLNLLLFLHDKSINKSVMCHWQVLP